MTHLEYLENYHDDLINSQKTPLLIELNQDDIKRLHNGINTTQLQSLPALVAAHVYDQNKDDKATNVIVIDGDAVTSPDNFILLEVLLEQLRHELKSIKNLAALKESLKAAASVATGGVLNDFIGDHLDKGLNFIFDEVGGHFASLLTDVVINNIDLSKTILTSVEGLLQDNAGNSLGDVINKISAQDLYLSPSAKSELNTLSNSFSKSQKIDVFQLTFKLLLAIALDAPKLIYINNPHKLDDNSIALLSLLFSFAKNQKELDKHVGVSVVYTYTDAHFHLYDDVDEALQHKQQLLVAQRRFVQRYAMLEKPGSDIPMVAVKSSLFIGRDEELTQLSNHFLHRKPTTFSVISGEPGIGKTALVNQHLANIQSQGEAIVLTLLNEVGHGSSNTGLSSLEKSINEETKRLKLLAGWKDKGFNFFKSMATKENAIKAAGTLVPGVDKALSIADTGYQRVMLDSHFDSVKQHSMGDLDDKQADEKQRQFDNLDKAIEKLKGTCSDPLPMVLFIDDLQWIDDTASEYILTRLLQQPDLYIVATLRPSDAVTLLKEQLARQSLHAYSLALLKACKVKGYEACGAGVDSSVLQAETITLNGFDKLALNQLIAKVIQGEAAQHEALANSIFITLAGGDARLDEGGVNTLFAVETINMLCDKKLYSENTLERLILDSPLRFNPDLQEVERVLAHTFSTLQSKYQDSFSHANKSSSGQRFNLMAYAVLEERLHLLKQYFGEQGNAAVNTLLFSSLLGAPFSSDLVKQVMSAVASTDVPELLPLKLHLVGCESETHLRPEHYAIIDEVYEILRRLSANDDKYQYRHGLLHTFLDKQFDYLLDNTLVENNLEAKDKLIGMIINIIFNVQVFFDYYDQATTNLTAEQIDLKLFYQSALVNVLKKGFAFNPDGWAKQYTASLIKLASFCSQNNKVVAAIELQEKAVHTLAPYFKQAPDVWAKYYTLSLNNMACCYSQSNQVDEAIELQEKTLKIREFHFQQAADEWAEDYCISLNNLARTYKQNNQWSKVVELQEKALNLATVYFNKMPDVWAGRYTTALNNLASSYRQRHQVSEAIKLQEKALETLEPYFNQAPGKWVENYTTSLNNLAGAYQQNNQVNDAIAIEEKSLKMLASYYKQAPAMWAGDYTRSLSNLASSYERSKRVAEAIVLLQQVVDIRELYFKQSPDVWVERYTTSLNNLASCYKETNQVSEAIVIEEKAMCILAPYFKNSPNVWAKSYSGILNNLAYSYHNYNQLDEAIELEEKASAIRESYFNQAQQIWAEDYTTSLINLASYYAQNNRVAEAIELQEKALHIRESYSQQGEDVISLNNLASYYETNNQASKALKLYEKALKMGEAYFMQTPAVWAERYTTSLINLASAYKKSRRVDDAIELETKAGNILESYFNKDPDVWAVHYTCSLNNLAYSYEEKNQLSEAITLHEKALNIREPYFKQSPDVWVEDYTLTLNNLASTYKQNSRVIEAIELEEKALNIRERYFQQAPDMWAKYYTTSLNNLAYSYEENNQSHDAIVLYEKALSILEPYFSQSQTLWAEDYTISLSNLACAYSAADRSGDALTLAKKTCDIYERLAQQSPQWQEEYFLSLSHVASLYLNLRNFQDSCVYFKRYFDIFSLDDIHSIEQVPDFIYPFVKYLQAAKHQTDVKDIAFDEMAGEFVTEMTDMFGGGYAEYIHLLTYGDEDTPAYIELADSNDPFDKEKYQIFAQYFCKS